MFFVTRALLLSVRPRFARALLSGRKTVEIRRKFPNVPAGVTVVIYSSSPEKTVIGTMRVRSFAKSNARAIWRDYSSKIGINESELRDYLNGAAVPSVLELEEPNLWVRPVPLEELRRNLQLEPAQSFRYLNSHQLEELERMASDLHGDISPEATVTSSEPSSAGPRTLLTG